MRPQDKKGAGGTPEASAHAISEARGLPGPSATCAVVGCPNSRGVLFCLGHGQTWVFSPERRMLFDALDARAPNLAAIERTALADFARRVAAEALNGRKP
jgi:hypothetical protein